MEALVASLEIKVDPELQKLCQIMALFLMGLGIVMTHVMPSNMDCRHFWMPISITILVGLPFIGGFVSVVLHLHLALRNPLQLVNDGLVRLPNLLAVVRALGRPKLIVGRLDGGHHRVGVLVSGLPSRQKLRQARRLPGKTPQPLRFRHERVPALTAGRHHQEPWMAPCINVTCTLIGSL
ncbi:hypothetical protein NL676_005544 [Syzygium grande]|nr:hypothetical protein NL676_005544 [Syzygium grande]